MRNIWILIVTITLLLICCEKESYFQIEKIGETIELPGLHIESYTYSAEKVKVSDVCFINESIGYIFGSDGMMKRTSHPKSIWTPMESGVPTSITTASFINSSVGFASGELMAGVGGNFNNSANLLKTINGGKNWTLEFIPEIARIWDFYYFNKNDGIAYLMAMLNGGETHIAKTNDGGSNWILLDLPIPEFRYLGPESTERIFVKEDICYIIADENLIYKSADFGNSWDTINPPTEIWRACFISKTTGFITDRDNISLTEDGGENWIELPDLPYSISAFHFFDRMNGYGLHHRYAYVGGDFPEMVSTILISTTDGGQSWSEKEVEMIIRGKKSFPTENLGYLIHYNEMFIFNRK